MLVESIIGKETCFVIRLPYSHEQTQVAAAPQEEQIQLPFDQG